MKREVLTRAVLVPAAMIAWSCSEGDDVVMCNVGMQKCGALCVNVSVDPKNCGACGVECPAGQICNGGRCTTMCPGENLLYCDLECVDVRYNPNHCGACGRACAPGESCSNGVCMGGSCPPGQTDCSGFGCVDLRSNPQNCGSCGHDCRGQACFEGACTSACPTGMNLCSGMCVDLTKDESHCGSCGHRCNAGEVCSGGECTLNCPLGFTNCEGECVDTQTNHANCGACGRACAAAQVCTEGVCRTGDCPAGQTNCSGSCVNTNTDEENCGSCGRRCDRGQSCENGNCVLTCPTGQTNCQGNCVDTTTDEFNCGGCGIRCRSDQVCHSGSCTCPGGLTECSGACVDTSIDPRNCGSCGNACRVAEACVEGRCSITCPPGTTACGGYCVDTSSDRNHCGACNNRCLPDEVCRAGSCEAAATTCLADSCATAIDVSGGGRFTGSTTCAGDDFSGSCGGAAGRDLVFKFTTRATKDIFISTHGSTFDTVIYVKRDSCDAVRDSYCNDDEHGTVRSELNLVDMPAGTYYLFLDGYSGSSHGSYVLDVYITDPSFEGDRCGDPEYFDLSSTTTLRGNTCPWYWYDANPDTVGCRGTVAGKDRVYYFIVTSQTTVTFSLCEGATWDTVLYLRSECNNEVDDPIEELYCDDDGCGTQSTITANLSPGLYYLWVDGYSTGCGAYTLTITR